MAFIQDLVDVVCLVVNTWFVVKAELTRGLVHYKANVS